MDEAVAWARKASPPLGGRSRCERFSLTRPPKRTERYGNSELVLRTGPDGQNIFRHRRRMYIINVFA